MNGSIGGNRPGKLVPVNRSAIGRLSQPAAPASQQIGDLARQMSEGSVGNMVPLVALGKAATTLAPGLIDYVFGTSTSLTPSALQEMGSRNDKTAFFKALLPMAIASERKYGVPASVIMAQAALESGWAQEPIGNNIFGVKGKGPAGSKLVSTTEEVHGRTVAVKAQFAMYHSIAEAVDDHGQVYNNGYYTKGLKDYARTKDPYRFIRLVGGTYATDSKYAASVTSLMKAYKLTKLAASQGGH